jgi:hypothetical protein
LEKLEKIFEDDFSTEYLLNGILVLSSELQNVSHVTDLDLASHFSAIEIKGKTKISGQKLIFYIEETSENDLSRVSEENISILLSKCPKAQIKAHKESFGFCFNKYVHYTLPGILLRSLIKPTIFLVILINTYTIYKDDLINWNLKIIQKPFKDISTHTTFILQKTLLCYLYSEYYNITFLKIEYHVAHGSFECHVAHGYFECSSFNFVTKRNDSYPRNHSQSFLFNNLWLNSQKTTFLFIFICKSFLLMLGTLSVTTYMVMATMSQRKSTQKFLLFIPFHISSQQ